MSEGQNGKSKKYPGVYWRQVKRHDGLGTERMYYIIYRRGGRGSKKIEEPIGRASQGITEAIANKERAARIGGKLSNAEKREEEAKLAAGTPENPTFHQLWDIYRTEHGNAASLRTQDYRYEKHIQPYIGNKSGYSIETSDINDIKNRMEKQNLAPQTIKHCLTQIRAILNYANKRGISKFPDHLIFEMPTVDNQKTENMTAEQLKAYFQAIDEEPDQDAASFLRLALLTGMRRGALMSLRWEDVDFERGTLCLRGEVAKNGKTSYIPLNQQALQVLRSINRTSDFVFPGREGGPRKVYRRIAYRVREKAGLPKSFRPLHGLRHCYASWLASSGQVDLYHLQKLLTHSSSQMTQRYAHLHDEALKKGAEIAGNIFQNLQDSDTE